MICNQGNVLNNPVIRIQYNKVCNIQGLVKNNKKNE